MRPAFVLHPTTPPDGMLAGPSCVRRAAPPTARRASRSAPLREYRTYLRVPTPSGVARVPLRAGSVFGLATSRGNREYQEDTWTAACVLVPPSELRASLRASWSRIVKQAAERWHPEPETEDDGQVEWFACYDG